MSFDLDQFYGDMRQRITALEKQLRKLPDDELMKAHEDGIDVPDEKQDAALMTATQNEVRRRFVATGLRQATLPAPPVR